MISTRVLRGDDPGALAQAVELLRNGEVIAIPTDTVYGIAADGFNADAIEKLYIVKERPTQKAIMLLLGSTSDLDKVASSLPDSVSLLAQKFWPGGLTLVVPARETLPKNLRADGETIGVRVPNSDLVRKIVVAIGNPLAATSANLSGRPNPTTASEVVEQLGGRIPLVIDGGAMPSRLASTVLDCTTSPPRVLREGAVPLDEINALLGVNIAGQE